MGSRTKSFRIQGCSSIFSVYTYRNDKVLLGKNERKIIYFDEVSNQIISIAKANNSAINCLIKNKGNTFFSFSK